MNQICLPIFHFSLIIILLVVSFVWVLYSQEAWRSSELAPTQLNLTETPTIAHPPPIHPWAADDLATGELPPTLRDQRRVYDLFKEPRRRYTDWPRTPSYGDINVSTSGYLEPYHVVGYLNPVELVESPQKGKKNKKGPGPVEEIATQPNQMLKLFGRRLDKYRHEYYVGHHKDPGIKIPLPIAGDREIMDRDLISVPGYPNQYRVNLYEIEAPKYLGY